MEWGLSFVKEHEEYMPEPVLILVLMEWGLSLFIPLGSIRQSRLNPCSNGMGIEQCFSMILLLIILVLILVLMEWGLSKESVLLVVMSIVS